MMGTLHERLEREAAARAAAHRARSLSTSGGIAFTSNDYLGLSRHPAIADALRDAIARGVPHGATGSRLLSGHHREHREAEERFAAFAGREAAILFGSGFLANHGLLSAIPSRRDLGVLDAAAHASLKEGARAGQATRRSFAHNDADDLRRALRDRDRFDSAFVVVEGVYSMDGDAGDLAAIDRAADEHDAHLIVDEAHATGLFGEHQRGIHETVRFERPPLATIHPCGKAIGCSGALIAADALVVDALVNTARSFIYSTAPAPLQAVAISAALELLPTMRPTVARLFALSGRLSAALAGLRRWRVLPSCGPIVAVVVGDTGEALRASARLRSAGLDVRAVRPPTVADGTSRLRITVTADRTESEIDALAGELLAAEEHLARVAAEVAHV
jgi:8-amino-7-oxononanoate synthase